MGIIKPPWITEEWFQRCPFNYCDHFGDKKELSLMCKICKDEIVRIGKYKNLGQNLHDLKSVFKDVGHDLDFAMEMIKRDAEKMGIDLSKISEKEYEEAPNPNRYKIYRLVRMYGDEISHLIKTLEMVPVETNKKLVIKALDALSHSRTFVISKIGRALSSRWEEKKDKFDDLKDSKTSAFMTYVAIERNSKALIRLAIHKPLLLSRKKFLKMARLSLDLMDLINGEFFPEFNPIVYEEFGCESYDKLFGKLGC